MKKTIVNFKSTTALFVDSWHLFKSNGSSFKRVKRKHFFLIFFSVISHKKNATVTSRSLRKFMNTVQYVENYNSTYNLRASLREFVPTNLQFYFMYNGSDNDPECYPRLRFVAARYIHDLSQEDIKKFQRIRDQCNFFFLLISVT